jgi:hypothetical protein
MTRGSHEHIVAYFGYGSLVNRATLRTRVVDAVPARLSGWRRCWRSRPDAPGPTPALLSVRPQADAAVDGLLVFDQAENLAAVDLREAHYDRRSVSPDQLEVIGALQDGWLADGCPVFVYEAKYATAGAHASYILQSYLDAVMQGFLREHGEESARRFVMETEGFDLAVLRDRENPLYPRAVTLSATERELFDRLLAARGIRHFDRRDVSA